MPQCKIKILAVEENYNFINEFRTSFTDSNEHYSFIQTDIQSFFDNRIGFDVLLFPLRQDNIRLIADFFFKANFTHEPPAIMVCDPDVTDDVIIQIPFKNKLIFKAPLTFEELKHNISVILKKSELEKKISDFEYRVNHLHKEIESLTTELGSNRINLEELSQTNVHLISATWREREMKKQLAVELDKIRQENELNKLNISELSATNDHLIAATWRERDLKKQLKEAMEAVSRSKRVIEEQNKRIEQSINYARKIQHAIHTREEDIKAVLPQSCIFYQPKDVVSGDFPWLFEKDDFVYIAAVDCTGHGVPGAMMSMIGNLLLNDLVNESGDHTPAHILNRLHKRIIKTLKQDTLSGNANDGMDIAMIRLNKKTNQVIFSSAHRPLVYITNKGEISIVKGDKFPIGGLHYERYRVPFTDTYITIEKDDMMFLFTDGLTDQIGGLDGKKIGVKNVYRILAALFGNESEKIPAIIGDEFEKWKGNNKQIDDILLIALRF